MDSLTQIALGAAVGEAVAGKKAGNKAILWGAVAGTIPDLDVLGANFMHTVDALDFHRGMTHSIVFAMILAPILGIIIRQIHINGLATFKDWTLLSFLALVTHPLLDCFTTWGTQLFWPFSEYRVAFKSIFVIDPLYTLPLIIGLMWLMFLPRESNKRRRLNRIGIILSTSYLILTLVVKLYVNSIFTNSFYNQNMQVMRYDSKPSPLNIILWSVTAEGKDGYYIGFYSLLDETKHIEYFYFPKNHELIAPFLKHEKVRELIKITDGWYMLEATDKGILFNDLRFGQRSGWEKGEGKFVFSYHIYEKNEDLIIEEVEKDMNEGKKMLEALVKRIQGKSSTL